MTACPPSTSGQRPAGLPEIDEPTVVHHFVRLSHLNYSVDSGFYPLGSCTMKYNPKINEWAARLPGFAELHPLVPDALAQGTLELMWRLQRQLGEIGGFPAVALQPAAGAHGELTGILVARAWHERRGDAARDEVIVPDSSHGTNPATAAMAGYRTVTVASRADGSVDLEALQASLGPRTAAVMLTNPSTLGLFERHILELLEAVHAVGALAYMDGANMNAVLGRFRPGAAGFDIMHFNLHKTFSTPHGGGGPGAGPIAVAEHLAPFLPGPLVVAEPDGTYRLERPGERPDSIGRMRAYQGSTGVLVRAFAYILAHGGPGLRQVSDDAVLAANYLRARVGEAYQLPFDGPLQARVRGHARRPSGRRPACAPLTSPSGSSTTATIRRPSTSPSSSRSACSSSRPRPSRSRPWTPSPTRSSRWPRKRAATPSSCAAPRTMRRCAGSTRRRPPASRTCAGSP